MRPIQDDGAQAWAVKGDDMVDFRMKIQEEIFGDFSDVDMDGLCLQLANLSIGYSHPHTLNFSVTAPSQTAPLARNAFIRFWDNDGQLGGDPQDETNCLFEGFLEDVKPGADANTVNYTAYDPTHLAAKKAAIMSAAWTEGDNTADPKILPQKAIGAVPRLVLNCANDADDDYAFARNGLGTAAQLIAGILEDQYYPLYWINAAPGDGSNFGGGLAYVWTDELERLTTIAQEKIVHESTTVRAAITQILTRFHPEWRMYWQPGARKFRFANVTAAPQLELKFNDPTSTYKILSVALEPTTEGRYGAIEYRGPETLSTGLFNWLDGGTSNTLVPLGSGVVLESYTDSNGTHDAIAYTSYQISNPAFRRGGKLLPAPYELVMDGNVVTYRGPVLQLSFDRGVTWTSTNTWFDHYNGIAYWYQPVYYWSDHTPPGSTQHYFPPNAARLVWPYYIDPIIVRSPGPESAFGGAAGSFIGTYKTVGNVEAEFNQYDEALAVGYEYGTPVTTVYRRAQFQQLTDSLLYERKDIAWVGTVTINGLAWDFAQLGLRINFTSQDKDGNPVTTGWEDINAWLTDVDYDLERGITTLTLNSDQLQNLGWDPSLLKERLKIKALQQVEYSTYQTIIQKMSDGLPWISGVVETTHFQYVDPTTGKIVDSTG